MYLSRRGVPMTAVAIIAYLVIIYFQPVLSERPTNGHSTVPTEPACSRAPFVPRNISVTQPSLSVSDATITWEAPTDRPCAPVWYIVTYELLYKDMCDRLSVRNIERTSYVQHPTMRKTINGLLFANSVYRICVLPWNERGWEDPVCVNFTTGFNDPAPVRELTDTLSNNQLVFSWSPPSCGEWHGSFHCYNFTLFPRDNAQIVTSGCAQASQGTQIMYPLDSLRGCTTYTFKIQVVTGTSPNHRRSIWIKAKRRTPTTAPDVPMNIRVAQRSGSVSVATVTWDAPTNSSCEIDWYDVTYELLEKDMCDRSSMGAVYSSGYVGHTSMRKTITGLFANSVYNICVLGGNNRGKGNPECASLKTGPKDPAPLRTPTVTQSDGQLVFSWTQPSCGELHGSFQCYNYALIRSDNEHIVNSGSTEYKHRTRKTYPIDALRACTAYTFKVEMITGTGVKRKTSGWEMVETQTPIKAPGVPRNINVSQHSGSVSVATVTWEAPTNSSCEANGYYVTYKLLYRDMCNRSSVEAVKRSGYDQRPTMFKMIEGLLSYSVYKICVHGRNDGGNGTRACANFTTGPKEPSKPPKRVKYTTVSYNSLTFTWDKPKCGDRNGPITDYGYIFNATLGNVSIHGNVTGYENGGIVSFNELIPTTTYSFRVRAINYNFPGSYGKELEANTSIAVYHPPSNINVTTLNETTAVVEWNTPLPSDFTTTGYRIEYWQSNHNETTSIVVSCEADTCPLEAVLEATITGLTPDTNHSIQVIAVYKYGEEASGTMVFKTPDEEVRSSSRGTRQATVIPVLVTIFVVIIMLLLVVASQLYSRKTNTQLFKCPGLFSFSLPSSLNSLRRAVTPVSRSAQTLNSHNSHTKREVNGDGLEMEDTCGVSQTNNRVCNSEMESNLSSAIYENMPSHASKHHAIPVGQLIGYVARRNTGGSNSFDADFKSLPSHDLHSKDIASQEENKEKNRFKNILPYDHSRVKLSVRNDDPFSDYINASFIDGYRTPKKYMAAQGPSLASVDDFWRMVWHYDSRKIVMLTNLREANKKKCEKYWPAIRDTYGAIVVTMAKEEIHDHYTVRYLNLVCNNTGRDIIQYHYTTWPDMGVPEYTAHLMSFIKITRQHAGPTIVHCSAGVGRTGTFLALDAMLDQVEAEQAVAIHTFIINMRQKRPHMVQTKRQYRFIYEALLQDLTCGDTSIPQSAFGKTYESLLSKTKGMTAMQQQFELLEAMTVSLQDEEVAVARDNENTGKNRFPDKVPAGRTRPFLMTEVEGGNNYINASFLPGCLSKNQYIGTQTPLPNTVADFWRLVVDYKVNTIVMLHGNSRDKTYAQYWNTDETKHYGSFRVEVLKEEYKRPIMHRTMEVTNMDSKKASSKTVKQLQLASCPPKSEVPPTLSDVMELYKALMSDIGGTVWQEGNSPLLIHCRDGEGMTGAFCAFIAVVDHLNTKHTIDVFHACKRLRTSRPGAVASLAQYQFIYEAVKSYLISTSIYENMAKIV